MLFTRSCVNGKLEASKEVPVSTDANLNLATWSADASDQPLAESLLMGLLAVPRDSAASFQSQMLPASDKQGL